MRLLPLLLLVACTVGDDVDFGVERDDDADDDDGGSLIIEAGFQPPPVGTRVTLGGHPAWVHFTNPPAHNGDDRNILREVIRLIDATPKGATIRAAIHSLVVNKVEGALLAAKARGVIVKVAHDGSDEFHKDESARNLAKALGADHVFCGDRQRDGNHGCITNHDSGIMHTKLFTFSKTVDPAGTTRDNVVWFGSANLSYASGSESFNNTITVYGDEPLYQQLNRYFTHLFEQRHFSADNYYDADAKRGFMVTDSARIYASPEEETDLVKARLNDIVAEPGCEVRVGMSMLFDSRLDLIDLLVKLKRGKCFVRVAGGSKLQPEAVRRLKAANIDITQGRVHDKYILVNARFAGSTQKRTLVFTGSHNWTKSANYVNDELFVRLEDAQLYDAYREHFRRAFVAGKPL